MTWITSKQIALYSNTATNHITIFYPDGTSSKGWSVANKGTILYDNFLSVPGIIHRIFVWHKQWTRIWCDIIWKITRFKQKFSDLRYIYQRWRVNLVMITMSNCEIVFKIHVFYYQFYFGRWKHKKTTQTHLIRIRMSII